MKILIYLNPRNLINYISHKLDVRKVKKRTQEDLQKEYRRDPNISVGEAVKELWEDLDWKLIGANDKHGDRRVNVFREALDSLRINETTKSKRLGDYLTQAA